MTIRVKLRKFHLTIKPREGADYIRVGNIITRWFCRRHNRSNTLSLLHRPIHIEKNVSYFPSLEIHLSFAFNPIDTYYICRKMHRRQFDQNFFFKNLTIKPREGADYIHVGNIITRWFHRRHNRSNTLSL